MTRHGSARLSIPTVALRSIAATLLSLSVAAAACSPIEETQSSTTSTAPETTAARPESTTATTTTEPPTTTDDSCHEGISPSGDGFVHVILDTDFSADVDDVGALAVLHALSDRGESEILAVMISELGDSEAAPAIDAVNTYYGRAGIPIGMVSGLAPQHPSRYTAAIAATFPNNDPSPQPAVDLYRRLLANQPDASVTIVSVGFLTNLAGLLVSQPDEHSRLDGQELVAKKVRRLVVMGGYYPDSVDHPRGAEFNFSQDGIAAATTIAQWPTPVLFSGWEIGATVLTGAALQTETPPDNPVREAYRLFNGGEDHKSFDLTAVLAAVRGTAGLFDVTTGTNIVGSDGSNTWDPSSDGCHGYLVPVVTDEAMGAALDELLIAPPQTRS